MSNSFLSSISHLLCLLFCAGTAIVTEQHAAMWTDGRYFLQASQQMDNNWTLMKMGNVPLSVSVVNDANNKCVLQRKHKHWSLSINTYCIYFYTWASNCPQGADDEAWVTARLVVRMFWPNLSTENKDCHVYVCMWYWRQKGSLKMLYVKHQ